VTRGRGDGGVKRRWRNEKKRTKRPECDEIGGHGDDGIRRNGGEREKSPLAISSNEPGVA